MRGSIAVLFVLIFTFLASADQDHRLERFLVNSNRSNGLEERQKKNLEPLSSSIKNEKALEAPIVDGYLTIITAAVSHRLTVELADTPEKSRKGLMFRKFLPVNHGMLFLMDGTEPAIMWMKNTELSLDMIFIDRQGNIINIVENTVPYSLDVIASKAPASAVLEVKAGTARRMGLKPGDQVVHPLIDPVNR